MSKTFDYISGKSDGPLAAAEARAEYIEGILESVLRENESLTTENAKLRALVKKLGGDPCLENTHETKGLGSREKS